MFKTLLNDLTFYQDPNKNTSEYPEITYFLHTNFCSFKRHTNFAIGMINVDTVSKPIITTSTNIVKYEYDLHEPSTGIYSDLLYHIIIKTSNVEQIHDITLIINNLTYIVSLDYLQMYDKVHKQIIFDNNLIKINPMLLFDTDLKNQNIFCNFGIDSFKIIINANYNNEISLYLNNIMLDLNERGKMFDLFNFKSYENIDFIAHNKIICNNNDLHTIYDLNLHSKITCGMYVIKTSNLSNIKFIDIIIGSYKLQLDNSALETYNQMIEQIIFEYDSYILIKIKFRISSYYEYNNRQIIITHKNKSSNLDQIFLHKFVDLNYTLMTYLIDISMTRNYIEQHHTSSYVKHFEFDLDTFNLDTTNSNEIYSNECVVSDPMLVKEIIVYFTINDKYFKLATEISYENIYDTNITSSRSYMESDSDIYKTIFHANSNNELKSNAYVMGFCLCPSISDPTGEICLMNSLRINYKLKKDIIEELKLMSNANIDVKIHVILFGYNTFVINNIS